MKILALESSATACSTALVRDGALVAQNFQNSGLTHSGVAAEAGVMVSLGRICLSASAITIAGKAWQGSVGIGIRLYKSHK